MYEDDKYDGTPNNVASKKMFKDAQVELVRLPYALKVNVEPVKKDQEVSS